MRIKIVGSGFALLLVALIVCLALEEKLHAKKSVIAGLFAIVTMLWGYVISRERISRIQWMGVAVPLAGVALVTPRSR